jgi:integrase
MTFVGLRRRPPEYSTTTQEMVERHAGHEQRETPIQPALMAILQDGFDAAPSGQNRIITLSRNNLRRNLHVIIRRAELKPWAHIFHAMRSSLASDWLAEFPVMDVTKWLGHSPTVAAKHYHKTIDSTIEKVTGKYVHKCVQISCGYGW